MSSEKKPSDTGGESKQIVGIVGASSAGGLTFSPWLVVSHSIIMPALPIAQSLLATAPSTDVEPHHSLPPAYNPSNLLLYISY